MKIIILSLTLALCLLSCTSCMNALAESDPELTAPIDSNFVPLDDFQKQIIRERYTTQSFALTEYSEVYYYDSFFEKNANESWCSYAPIDDQKSEYTLNEMLSMIQLGMSAREVYELLGPLPPAAEYGWTQLEPRTIRYYSSEGHICAILFSHGGLGTQESPFRWVVSAVAYQNIPGGGALHNCGRDTVAKEMELGILPTFLAVELHGTEYLISEGLLTEAEAVFYAKEQEIYIASQAEQGSLPDAEIPETAPEAVVQ